MRYRHLLSAVVGCILLFSKQATSYPVTTASPSSPNNSSASNSTFNCDAECLHELLPLLARSGAASGVRFTLNAYNAVDWCDAHDKCGPVIEEKIGHIAGNIVKILPSHIYSACDYVCVYEAGKNATTYAMASSITWLSNILGRTSLVDKQGEATDSVAKLQWLRWQLGMEHNNFTVDYDLLIGPEARNHSQSLGSRPAVRKRLAERGVKDIWSTISQYSARLWKKAGDKLLKLWQKIFRKDGTGQYEQIKTIVKESPYEVPDVVSPVEVPDMVFEREIIRQFLEEVGTSTDPEEEARIRFKLENAYSADTGVDELAQKAKTDQIDWNQFKGPRDGREAREFGMTKEYAVASRDAGLARLWRDGKGKSLDIMADNHGVAYLEANLPSGGVPLMDSPTKEDSSSVQTIEVSSDDTSPIKSEALKDAIQKLGASGAGLFDDDLTQSLTPSEIDLRIQLRDYNIPGTRYSTAPRSPLDEISDGGSSQVSPKTVPKEPPSDLPPPPKGSDWKPGGPGQEPEQPINDPSEPASNHEGSSSPARNGPDGPPVFPDPQTKPGQDFTSNPLGSQIDLNELANIDSVHNDPFTHVNPGSPGSSLSSDPGLLNSIDVYKSPVIQPEPEPLLRVEPIRLRPIRPP